MERLSELIVLIASQLDIEAARVWPSLVFATWVNASMWLVVLVLIEVIWSVLGVRFYKLLTEEHDAKYPDGVPEKDTYGSLNNYESDLADTHIWAWCTLVVWCIGTIVLLLCVPNLITRLVSPEAMTIMDILSKK